MLARNGCVRFDRVFLATTTNVFIIFGISLISGNTLPVVCKLVQYFVFFSSHLLYIV